MLRGLAEFQEHLGGRLTIMLLEDIGRPFDAHEIRTDLMVRSIEILKAIDAGRSDGPAQRASSTADFSAGKLMDPQPHHSPMTAPEIVDEYFIENRNRLLEIAAFLDRLDRADPAGAGA